MANLNNTHPRVEACERYWIGGTADGSPCMCPNTVRYFPQVQQNRVGPWAAPSVFGIKDGFDNPEEAVALLVAVRDFDDYYKHYALRVVKVTTEVFQEVPNG